MCSERSSGRGYSVAGALNRRSVLTGIGGAAATVGLAACGTSASSASAPTGAAAGKTGGAAKLEIVLLGTFGGPPIQPDRTGISTALVVDGHTYLVDCGRAAATQYVKSGLRLSDLEAIFLTHLHADHIADYYDFFLLGGSIPNRHKDTLGGPVAVYGPGPAGGLSPKFGGGTAPTVAPDDPTPGTRMMTQRCHEAYAYSSNMFARDMGIRDIRTLTDVHEIDLPGVKATFRHRAPRMEPFTVMSDDRVTVSAVLVPHGPVFPSFAFRFDTDHGSVTFSGDTTYSDNLTTLAHGSDVLLHEAINLQGSKMPTTVREHMLESHVEVQKVGSIAQRAGVRHLILTHIGDMARRPIDAGQWTTWAQHGFDGKVTVGQDLHRFTLA